MSPRSPRKGRSLELLVKRIKEHQSPDAKVTSPEFVPDIDTGQPREVDIGIRTPRDAGTLFIAIECRDRTSDQAVDWIEQLISKKQSICADVLVAVTSSKFSTPARTKALKHGIILARMTKKLPEELAQLASSFFITLNYLAPKVVTVDLQLPGQFTEDLNFYKYKHKTVDRELSLLELAQVWTTPNLVRTIPRYIEDLNKEKFAKIELLEIDADVVVAGNQSPIYGARISYELNYGELELSLRAVQELAVLDGEHAMDASAFVFATDTKIQSEVIVDKKTGSLRWDVLGKSLLDEGKVLIGASLKASKPVSITTMMLDL